MIEPFPKNLLCYGDNLRFLADPDLFPPDSVNLIYLDPPRAGRNWTAFDAAGEDALEPCGDGCRRNSGTP